VTAIGHAETGRLWQSRGFWEHLDQALSVGGNPLHLHDAYRASQVQPSRSALAEDAWATTVTAPALVAHIAITWASGEITTVEFRCARLAASWSESSVATSARCRVLSTGLSLSVILPKAENCTDPHACALGHGAESAE
jgi:hypothetical protein